MINKFKTLFEINSRCKISRQELREIQFNKLQKVIWHAYNTTTFYHKRMQEAGVHPRDLQSLQDLSKFPTITKSEVQANYQDIVSKHYSEKDCKIRNTSGSSGKILKVLWEPKNFWIRLCSYYRSLSMIGYNPFKKLLYFLPTPENPGFNLGLFRQMGLELDLSFDRIKKQLLDFKPHIMGIYPSHAMELGNYLTDQDIANTGIEAISLNSEMILPRDKAYIENRFGCPAYDEYSSVEMGFIASMCKHKGMHVFSDNVVLEILGPNGEAAVPGERGEIVLTSLTNFAMPFIRYRIKDYSCFVEGECGCGMPFPLIGPIEGRKDDSFLLENGNTVPAWKIYELVERPLEEYSDDKWIVTDFYLEQKDKNLADFYYVKGYDFDPEYLRKLNKGIKSLMGENFNLRLHETRNIERVKTGKRKYIHCGIKEEN